MKYKSFEELPVWNLAIELGAKIFVTTGDGGIDRYAGLRNQIERAVVSVSNNIAEGFERGTHGELLTFFYYALGSAGEVRSMLLLLQRIPGGSTQVSGLDDLLLTARNVSRQLNGWIESLKDGKQQSPRHQNTKTRTQQENAMRGQKFLEELERIKNQAKKPPQDT